MAHEHPVVDADKRFLIDPITRIVKNAESKKTVLVQNDHNSERLSFELDRYVEGHDMLESTSVHIHYDNVGNNKLKNSGVYEVDDIQPSPDDSTKVVFTWLVSQHATSLVGALNFSITFECEADGVVEYRWSTILNTNDVQICEGLDNGETVVNTYADILTKWKNELYSIIYTNPTFAEVCRWEDDNVDDEYRVGYFVSVEPSDITEESLIVKATAASTIRGVTMESPGFAANNNDYKFDDNGKLLPQYEYVGFSGFIPVIDNGTCSVNGWCKPGDKGTAEPTDDNTGYRVIERVDETHVLILVEPQGAISTLIAKDTEIAEALANHVNALTNLITNHTTNKDNPHGLDAVKIGARPSTWMPTAAQVGALPNDPSSVRKSVNFIGTNPINTPEDDITANWIALGSGWAYINSSDKLKNQPATWGFVENIVTNGLVYQVWHSMTTAGTMFHRGGSSSGWYTDDWKKLGDGDALNISTYTNITQLGLTDEDFVVDDLEANLWKIHKALPTYGQLSYRGSSDNLNMSIKNRINSDCGMNFGSSNIIAFRYVKFGTESTPAKIEVLRDVGSTKNIWIARVDGQTDTIQVDPFIDLYNPNGFLSLAGGTLTGQTIGLYDLYGRITAGAGTLQLEARANKSADNKRTLFVRSSQSVADLAKGVQLIDNYLDSAGNVKSDYYNIYGMHNVTAGTTDLTAGSSALTTDCYYDVYK